MSYDRLRLRGYHPHACRCYQCNEQRRDEGAAQAAAQEEARRVAEYDRRVAEDRRAKERAEQPTVAETESPSEPHSTETDGSPRPASAWGPWNSPPSLQSPKSAKERAQQPTVAETERPPEPLSTETERAEQPAVAETESLPGPASAGAGNSPPHRDPQRNTPQRPARPSRVTRPPRGPLILVIMVLVLLAVAAGGGYVLISNAAIGVSARNPSVPVAVPAPTETPAPAQPCPRPPHFTLLGRISMGKTVLPILASSFIILLLAVACGSDSPVTKTLVWEPYDGETIYIDVPLDWEWDEKANIRAEHQAKKTGSDIPHRYVRAPFDKEDEISLAMSFSLGSVYKWVEIAEEISEENPATHYRHWDGDLNGVPTIFESRDYPDSIISLVAFVMPEGDEWSWRFQCAVDVAEKEQLSACKSIIDSIRLN